MANKHIKNAQHYIIRELHIKMISHTIKNIKSCFCFSGEPHYYTWHSQLLVCIFIHYFISRTDWSAHHIVGGWWCFWTLEYSPSDILLLPIVKEVFVFFSLSSLSIFLQKPNLYEGWGHRQYHLNILENRKESSNWSLSSLVDWQLLAGWRMKKCICEWRWWWRGSPWPRRPKVMYLLR